MSRVLTEYKDTKIGLLPKDWEVKKAKYIFESYTNKNHDGDLEILAVTQDKGVVPRSSLEIDIKSSDASIKTYKKVEKGNFIISLRSFQGGIEYSEIEGIVSPAYTVLKSKIEINNIFYKYLLKKEDFISRLNSAVIGIREGKQISYNDFGELYLQIPPINEQKKIAEIISTWDLAIEKQEQLIEKKKEFKKGLMQRLLTGEVRFKEFKEEWKVVSLGSVFERVTQKNDIDCSNVLTISAQNGLVNQEEYFKKSVSSKDLSGYYLLRKGDFAYNKSYSNGYPLGAIKRLNDYEEGVVSPLYICFTAKENISTCFYEQYFESGALNNEIMKIAQEGARNHGLLNISVTEFFKDIKIVKPTIEEQNKIAEIFIQADKEIELLEKELEALKLQKKGLMQRLLTGEARVKI
ncbi:MAG: restriction endonuclease subunit S [Clostridium sp.]|jgi:type I restriction enzyme, S subunit|uniref:restriction endonuclease subunit S n=1 Tax=Clostridium TaxID=1485 RepID=UPI00232F19FB|nr:MULTISPECIES: restriction endonuclease subunit S [Clostridium]MDB1934979.1 restriction endonuclease subunit S [Clostridium tertium]MDB1939086.1 restriction endonuclease subunit S [Clostridium tertium]MDU3548168.1 restriction endonuclease subunit S [Clostridium sp.]MDY4604079.1 restriction endonuclease subunit S [Clostridium tertium]